MLVILEYSKMLNELDVVVRMIKNEDCRGREYVFVIKIISYHSYGGEGSTYTYIHNKSIERFHLISEN